MDFVRRWSEASEIGAGRFVGWLGVAASKFYDWRTRYGEGAEYSLTESAPAPFHAEPEHVTYDASAEVLHFTDGSFWTMGSISASGEQDAGSLYPTVMEDSNGNQLS